MNKEIIEKYIQFSIYNGYKNPNIKLKQYVYGNNVLEIDGISPNVIQIITSKEFIEAIVSGLKKEGINDIDIGTIGNIWNLETKITHKQAIAIRDEKLEEFIDNLIL